MTARTQIQDWLRTEGRKKSWLAAQIGVNRSTLSNWLAGRYKPEEASRAKLQDQCGVHPDAWGRT